MKFWGLAASAVLGAAAVVACATSSTNIGKASCADGGTCPTGTVCNPATLLCVSGSGGSTASGGTGGSGTGGTSFGGSGGSTSFGGSTSSGGFGGTGGTTSSGGVGGSGGSGAGPAANIGANCMSNAECTNGAICVAANSTTLAGGGPAGGLCTIPCSDDSACAAAAPGTVCLNFGDATSQATYCTQTCFQGGDMQNPNKCSGRGEMACAQLSNNGQPTGTSACIPTCLDNRLCPSGTVCNKNTALCTATQHPGLALGAKCDPNAVSDPCAGFCLNIVDDQNQTVTGFCSETCSSPFGCGLIDINTDVGTGGLCLLSSSGTGIGDLAYCAQTCNCNNDCSNPDFVCDPLSAADAMLIGKAGVCFTGTAPDGGQSPGIVCP